MAGVGGGQARLLGVAEGGVEFAHDAFEVAQGVGVEAVEDGAPFCGAGVEDLLGEGVAFGGELDAAVGVFAAGGQALRDDAVDDAGDGAEADAELAGQFLAGGGAVVGEEHDDFELRHGEVGRE